MPDEEVILENATDHHEVPDHHQNQELKSKKLSWQKLRRYDSLDLESRSFTAHHGHASKGGEWSVILHLAFQSIGIVYGDIGTSPLYVYSSTFTKGINHDDDILGVLSLILYTLTLIPLIKYVFVVLRANDNGDGGTFALYSLLCRYAKVGLTPSQQAEDRDVSNFELELPSKRLKRASRLKSKLENSPFAKVFLLFATMLGTSMVIGDGVLTPCISVLSAVGGIKEATSAMTEDRIVWISIAILICLFMVQRFGTDKVGYTFAPIICVWFTLIGGIGVYNFIKFDPTVVKALNPQYIVDYFRRNKKDAWISLGGIVLAITGTEALFADVGHFTVRSIQISMCAVTYPALILAYTGQASFLRNHHHLVYDTFFKSIPGPLYWPMFVAAVLASIIASQAMISGTFSIIQQSLSLGCFPRVKIVHTSARYAGQVYIPEVNYLLMLACVGVTLGFRTTAKIGNAYGIAVVFVMTLTSSFLVLIMIMIWKTNILLVISYVLVIGSVELMYLSSVLYKFNQGGYLPLAFAMVLMIIMFVWNDVHRRKYYYELGHKISPEQLKEIAVSANFCRMPGLAMFYSELVQGIPPIFNHYATNVPALHSVLVFVSIKSLPISKVPLEERFLFRRVEPKELNVFRCVARYGYTDVRNEHEPFEGLLVEKLKEFIKDSFWISQRNMDDNNGEKFDIKEEEFNGGVANGENGKEDAKEVDDQDKQQDLLDEEIEAIDKAWRWGVVHLIGENEVTAAKGAGMVKRILIDYAYNFLKRNLRQSDKVFDIPHKRMLKVGMTYEL
ncbi:PREDICTED: potassium transporter 5-like [Prunus mume]|uniref:Potassium transporter n=1 Tax=Prunus mume TaxID=102107 RepID=A0ABM0P6E0_PRUMU|nr:PREDICTED: potassium transporter 5-like [Prunus mume]